MIINFGDKHGSCFSLMVIILLETVNKILPEVVFGDGLTKKLPKTFKKLLYHIGVRNYKPRAVLSQPAK